LATHFEMVNHLPLHVGHYHACSFSVDNPLY